jgi:F1F0 ATPase subunit 2
MIDTLMLALAFVIGTAIGTWFYLGLWWTIRRGLASSQPALWFSASLALRLGIALAALFAIGREHWPRLVLCLLGMVFARLVVTWMTRPGQVVRIPQSLTDNHAP